MEVLRSSIIIWLVTGTSVSSSSFTQQSDENTGYIDIPVSDGDGAGDYSCRGWKVDNRQEMYLVDVKPQQISENVHHIMLYGCETGITHYRSRCRSVCAAGTGHVLFVWGKDIPDIHFPRGDADADVGFRIGLGATLQFIIIQVHYGPSTGKINLGTKEAEVVDYRLAVIIGSNKSNDGFVRLTLTSTRPTLVAGILIQSISNATIPAKSKNANVDITCLYNENIDLHVFAYRMHTHSLGESIASYKVNDTWHLMAYGSPQWLQAFYPLRNHFDIKKGDYLVTRCNYSASNRDRDTKFGFTLHDEMCNIYLMFYTNASSAMSDAIQFHDCHGNNFPELVSKIPSVAELQMDQRQSPGANVEYYDTHGQEVVDQDATDRNAPRYFRRRYGSPYTLYSPRYADVWHRNFADQSTDAAGNDEVERQRSRWRHKSTSSGYEYQSDPKVDDSESPYEQSESAGDASSKQLTELKDDSQVLSVGSASSEAAQSFLNATTVARSSTSKEALLTPTMPSTSSVTVLSTLASTPTPNIAVPTPVGVHQSVKKDGVGLPHLSIDSNVDELTGDTIEENAEQPSIMGASLIISILIIVPLTIVIVVTVCSRLRKKGMCTFGGAKRRSRHLNLGNLLSRGQRNGGFRQLNGDSDKEYQAELLDPLHSEDESEVEEFSNTPSIPRKA